MYHSLKLNLNDTIKIDLFCALHKHKDIIHYTIFFIWQMDKQVIFVNPIMFAINPTSI